MKIISPLLLVPVILACLFGDVLPSNPDSEIIQDSSEENEDKGKKFAQMRNAYGQPRALDDSYRSSGISRVRVLRPIVSGSRIIWREVDISEGIERTGDTIPFYSVWKGLRVNRPNSMIPTDKKTDVNSGRPVSGNRPQRPLNNGGGNNYNVPQASDEGTSNNFPSVPYDNGEPSSGTDNRSQNDRIIGNLPNDAQNRSDLRPPNGQNRRYGYIPYNNRNFPRNRTSDSDNRRRPVPPVPQNPQSPSGNPSNVPERAETAPNKRVSPDTNFFAGIVNNFAFKLIETLNPESNFVISPLSIFIALSMCYLGSDGNTKAQLEQTLGMNDNAVHGEHLHQGIKDLMSLIMPESSEYQLFVANGMFLGRNFTTDAQFEENIRKYYAAELKNLDFRNPQSSLPAINDWVARNTRNMIPSLMDSPPSPLTRLILLNAIYFKGIWKTQFPVNFTKNSKFYSMDGTEKEVPTMTLRGETFPLYQSNDHRHTFIKLPYEGNQISMIIALPNTESARPMPSVTDQILCYVQDAMTNTELDTVAIPKFRLEHTMSLRRPLMQLGINDIFNRNVVNLRKLRKQNDVYVSAILHKAVVDVNEEGTTASATTAVRLVPLRLTRDFIANHPFAFYIVHEPSGLVLFYGKIFDPEGNAGVPLGNRRENVQIRRRPNSQSRDSSSTVNRNPSRVGIHGAVNYEDNE